MRLCRLGKSLALSRQPKGKNALCAGARSGLFFAGLVFFYLSDTSFTVRSDRSLTFFPADPNVEVLEAVKRRNLELLTRAEAAERQIVANEARITELTRLKDELAEDASRERQRAEAAEARVKHLDDMLEMLPEYLEYWDACDGPALSLSEWYTYRDGYQE